jgi:hypothetical protein
MEALTMAIAAHTVYSKLGRMDELDPVTSAFYRQLAQEMLADANIGLGRRQAIADRLNQVNHRLALQNRCVEDSY